MSKFATASRGSTRTTNYMGGAAFQQPPKEELAFAVLTTFVENMYYEKASDRLDRIKGLVEKTDPEFVAKLAVYARSKFHLRSISQALIGTLSRAHRGDSLVPRAIKAFAERPDDLVELVGFVGRPLPNGVKNGVADALGKFDRYQLAKYRMEGKRPSLVDVVNLVHPKPTQANAEALTALVNGELREDQTWESRLSKGEDKKTVWSEMVPRKLGYMALLRNLRNILTQSDPDTIRAAIARIQDPEAVRRSKQLPYRFLSAWIEINKMVDGRSKTSASRKSALTFEDEKPSHEVVDLIPEVKSALTNAANVSVANIPLLPGRTLILSDNSGSMRGDLGGSSLLSAISDRTTADAANLFAVLYWTRAENTAVGVFGDTLIEPTMDRSQGIFENFRAVNEAGSRVGPATEEGIFDALEDLVKNRRNVDRVMIFSDQQVGERCTWYDRGGRHGNDFNKLFQQYRKINPEAKIYSVDLRGYGNKLFSDGVFLLAGFSERIFDLMQIVEQDRGAFLKEIEAVEL